MKADIFIHTGAPQARVVSYDQYLSNKQKSDLSGKIVGNQTNTNARRSLTWDTEYEKLMLKAISAKNYG
jgi:hypothetical protein